VDRRRQPAAGRRHRTLLHLRSQCDDVGPAEPAYSAADMATGGRNAEDVQVDLVTADSSLGWTQRRSSLLGIHIQF